MNNSKLSETSSSADMLTEPRAYDCRPTWDNSSEKFLLNSIPPHGGYCNDTVGIECLDRIAIDSSLNETTQVRPLSEPKKLDLGLWLLCGSVIRQSQWKQLQEKSQGSTNVEDFSLKCSPAIKRSFDVTGSLLLLVILSPLFILMAILIKLDSPGPVFFRHHRIGKNGKTFILWKFRSMKVNVPKYAISPQSATDSRLTRIGRLIRRLSIDEIPQLINVLRGEMSLVGPRPEMPFIVKSYRSIEYVRLAVRPGITGLWQISPARAFPIHENLQYDFHYIFNQNLVLDCAIILRTISAVILGVGAV